MTGLLTNYLSRDWLISISWSDETKSLKNEKRKINLKKGESERNTRQREVFFVQIEPKNVLVKCTRFNISSNYKKCL